MHEAFNSIERICFSKFKFSELIKFVYKLFRKSHIINKFIYIYKYIVCKNVSLTANKTILFLVVVVVFSD